MNKFFSICLTLALAGYWIPAFSQSPPQQGEIIITEIMANPEVVSDTNGEWFEIWNSTDRDILLNGLVLGDAGTNHHVISGDDKIILPAHAFRVLGRNGDPLTNGGAPVHYVYQNFTLSNTSDQIILTNGDGILVDQVAYSSGWPVVSGASIELNPDCQSFSGNDDSSHWRTAQVPFGSGDKGSPGKGNPFAAGLENRDQDMRMDVYPNPSYGRFMVEAKFCAPLSGEIRLTNLLGQIYPVRTFVNRENLSEIIEMDWYAPGIWFVQVVAGKAVQTVRIIMER